VRRGADQERKSPESPSAASKSEALLKQSRPAREGASV